MQSLRCNVFLNRSINFESWDVMMSISTQGKVCFWIYLESQIIWAKIVNKNCKHYQPKMNSLRYTATLSISWKSLELISNLHNRVKNKSEIFVISCTNTWPNFMLILPRTPQAQSKVLLLKSTHVYDDVSGFEVSALLKNTKI